MSESVPSVTTGAPFHTPRARTRAKRQKILRRYVARFDALDARERFIGTIEVEDIADRFDELRFLESTTAHTPWGG